MLKTKNIKTRNKQLSFKDALKYKLILILKISKKKEIQGLIDYINKSKIDLTKVIFVMDRVYFSYELFKTLNDKNIKFVIRVRNNCQHLQKYLNENKEKNCEENHKPKNKKTIKN